MVQQSISHAISSISQGIISAKHLAAMGEIAEKKENSTPKKEEPKPAAGTEASPEKPETSALTAAASAALTKDREMQQAKAGMIAEQKKQTAADIEARKSKIYRTKKEQKAEAAQARYEAEFSKRMEAQAPTLNRRMQQVKEEMEQQVKSEMEREALAKKASNKANYKAGVAESKKRERRTR